jgi:hypothetical protein
MMCAAKAGGDMSDYLIQRIEASPKITLTRNRDHGARTATGRWSG